MNDLESNNLVLLSYKNDFISAGFGEEMVQARFEVINHIIKDTYNFRYLTKNIVESEESLVGLGF